MGDRPPTRHPDDRPRTPEGFFDALGISSPKRLLIFLGCLAIALLASLYVGVNDLDPPARRALFILVFAGLLWVTEAIPAFAVGILVIGLQIALLGDPEGVFARTSKDWEEFVAVIGHPLIWLFFGGFVLAAGMKQTGLDRHLVAALMRRLGDRPSIVLLGLMVITFTLSMFMSNTATTAMVLAMVGPLLARLGKGDRFATGLLVGIAVAANLGGMGSLIGTPPNAIAVGTLSDLPDGPQITFLDWMVIGLPPAVLLLVASWLVLARLYPASTARLHIGEWGGDAPEDGDDDAPVVPFWEELVVGGTLLLTVGLWLTSQWHGLPTAVVSFVPIVFLTTTSILGTREIRGLNYDVLFLIAGGLALGNVVIDTGLARWIVEQLPLGGLGTTGLVLLLAYVTVILSNLMSNTAAANILIPIGVTLAAGFEARVAVSIALASSCAMCLPIATPPNALAFATGRVETRDFIRIGLMLGLVAPLIVVLWTSIVLDWIVGG